MPNKTLERFGIMIEQVDLKRYEFKYFIDEDQYHQILDEIRPFIELDKYSRKAPEHRYSVHSLYLDSHDRTFYEEKLGGYQYRKKIRIRCYNPQFYAAEKYFLEIKRRNQLQISKGRVPLSREAMLFLLEHNFLIYPDGLVNGNGKVQEVLEEIIYTCNLYSLLPTVYVLYEREAYQSKIDDTVRVTFDRNVKSYNYYSPFDEDQISWTPTFNGKMIFEIKVNGLLPFWLHQIIKKHGLWQEAISKYCGGLVSAQGLFQIG